MLLSFGLPHGPLGFTGVVSSGSLLDLSTMSSIPVSKMCLKSLRLLLRVKNLILPRLRQHSNNDDMDEENRFIDDSLAQGYPFTYHTYLPQTSSFLDVKTEPKSRSNRV